jgi:hypothetical protein
MVLEYVPWYEWYVSRTPLHINLRTTVAPWWSVLQDGIDLLLFAVLGILRRRPACVSLLAARLVGGP